MHDLATHSATGVCGGRPQHAQRASALGAAATRIACAPCALLCGATSLRRPSSFSDPGTLHVAPVRAAVLHRTYPMHADLPLPLPCWHPALRLQWAVMLCAGSAVLGLVATIQMCSVCSLSLTPCCCSAT